MFSSKGNIDADNTISDFETSCVSFDEEKFEKWLVDKNLITRYRVCLPTTYVNPINSVELPIPPSRVLKKSETELEEGVKQQKSQVETSKTVIVPSLGVKSIDIQTVVSILPLDPITQGSCPICKKRDVSLVWQVLFRDGSRYDAVCMDCGGYLQEELRKRDQA